jgi:hypothetical protein
MTLPDTWYNLPAYQLRTAMNHQMGPGESLMVIFQLDISCIIQNSKKNQIAFKTYNNNNNNNHNNDHKQ